MSLLSLLRSAIDALLHRARVENDTEEELRCHVQNRADDLERPVERDVLEECLRLAQQAPTAGYAEDWHFVVVTDAEQKAGLADLWRQGATYGRSRPLVRRRLKETGAPAPSPVAGWRSWLWLLIHLPGLRTRQSRAAWIWVAANRIGHLQGSVRHRCLLV